MGRRFDRFRAWMNDRERNDRFVDGWSGAHFLSGVAAGWLMDPFVGLLILVLWEPLEILVLSPLADKLLKMRFGFETLRNAMSDIVFDALGVAVGFWLLRWLVEPPFVLFA